MAFNKAELLKVENLVKRYRNFTLNDVSLSVSEGEICGIIGSNGAGKTTLLKSIMGVIHTDGSNVWLYGKRAADDIIDFKARVGYIGDFEQAYPEMECTHIYRFAKNIYKEKWDDAKFNYLVHDVFGLDLRQKIKLFSAGMKKKFWLAVVLAHSPRLLLLDEPTASLDPVSRDEILDVISELARREGVGVLFSTHITEDLGKIAHRIILLQDGRILLDGAASEIFGLYGKINVQDCGPSEIDRILEDCGGVLSRGYAVVKKSGAVHDSAEPANLDDIILYERKKPNVD